MLLSNLNFNILSFYDSLGFIPTGIFPTSSHSNEWKIAWPLDWLIQRICFVQFKCYSFVIYNLITILISKICRNLVLNKMLLEHRCILFKFADLIPHHRLNNFHILWQYYRELQTSSLYMDFNINNFRDINFVSKFHNLPKFDSGFWVITFTKHYKKV